jgi:hypothetical protein
VRFGQMPVGAEFRRPGIVAHVGEDTRDPAGGLRMSRSDAGADAQLSCAGPAAAFMDRGILLMQ